MTETRGNKISANSISVKIVEKESENSTLPFAEEKEGNCYSRVINYSVTRELYREINKSFGRD